MTASFFMIVRLLQPFAHMLKKNSTDYLIATKYCKRVYKKLLPSFLLQLHCVFSDYFFFYFSPSLLFQKKIISQILNIFSCHDFLYLKQRIFTSHDFNVLGKVFEWGFWFKKKGHILFFEWQNFDIIFQFLLLSDMDLFIREEE